MFFVKIVITSEEVPSENLTISTNAKTLIAALFAANTKLIDYFGQESGATLDANVFFAESSKDLFDWAYNCHTAGLEEGEEPVEFSMDLSDPHDYFTQMKMVVKFKNS